MAAVAFIMQPPLAYPNGHGSGYPANHSHTPQTASNATSWHRGEENIVQIVAQLRTAGSMSAFLRTLIIGAICVSFGSGAFSKDLDSQESDDDDGSTKQTSGVPTMYLDFRTNYANVPAGSLPIGLGSPALFTALQALPSPAGNPLLTLPISLPLASRQAVWVDVPATVDVTDHVSLYAGVTGSSTSIGTEGWSSFAVTSWNVGFQADLYNQNGG